MIRLQRTHSADPDFLGLVKQLNRELAERDGKDHAFFARFNGLDDIKQVVVAYIHHTPAGCGAIKPFDARTTEVKRMYVPLAYRKKGIATAILNELEKWTAEQGYQQCILETGLRQPEAIALYRKNGYAVIPNYGPYEKVTTSVCFEKKVVG